MMLDALSDDVLSECRELDALVSRLDDDVWERRTAFFGWTVSDQIMHLHQVDLFGLTSLRDPEGFADRVRQVRHAQSQGIELSEQARRDFGALPKSDLLDRWRRTYEDMAGAIRAAGPKQRMAWFGPDMSVASFASARQMEAWAHGQDIHDLLDEDRPATDRLRNICELGVRTFAWSFRNRGLEPPPSPSVELIAPSGAVWRWPGDGAGTVTGPALDFALVVTQRRAPEDVDLAAQGEGGRLWLPIAQCFAGAPQEPATPGSRRRISQSAGPRSGDRGAP